MVTASGFKNRLIAEAPALNINISSKQAEKLGIKLARRAERMGIVNDFYDSLRILGIITDTTARDANRNLEKAVTA